MFVDSTLYILVRKAVDIFQHSIVGSPQGEEATGTGEFLTYRGNGTHIGLRMWKERHATSHYRTCGRGTKKVFDRESLLRVTPSKMRSRECRKTSVDLTCPAEGVMSWRNQDVESRCNHAEIHPSKKGDEVTIAVPQPIGLSRGDRASQGRFRTRTLTAKMGMLVSPTTRQGRRSNLERARIESMW